MSNIYIGYDNGLTGAMVAVANNPRSDILWKLPMPVQVSRKGNELDVTRIWAEFLDMDFTLASVTFILEEPGGAKNAKAAVSMAASFHAVRGMLAAKCVRHIRITPQSWQKHLLPGCKSGDTKPRALALAKELWPDESFLASPRCRVAHDGMVDAALIAHYGRLKQL